MGWTKVDKPQGQQCLNCGTAATRGIVWLLTKLGLFCSSQCFTEYGGDVWDN